MLENSFIKSYASLVQDCTYIKPIAVGESFILRINSSTPVSLKDLDGNSYDILQRDIPNAAYSRFTIIESEHMPENNTCCYLEIKITPTLTFYSNMLAFMNNTEGLAKLSYRCDADAFGFPFSSIIAPIVSWLPINLKNPQLKQEDKTYVKRTGEVVVLMAKYYKEWEAESEYLSEEMHDKIVAALSCDYVEIDDVRLTKSDSYEIDWGNTIKKACGQKLAKATWKMRANVTERNSNC